VTIARDRTDDFVTNPPPHNLFRWLWITAYLSLSARADTNVSVVNCDLHMVSRGIHIVSRGIHLVSRGIHLVYRAIAT
jgi:hypothetical protein